MKIRIMNISDYIKVYDLWTRTSGMGMRSFDDSKAGIEKFLKRNPTTNFVAEWDNKIAGVILCGHDGRRGYIYHTAVDAGYRRKGIGRALVDAVIKALKEENINKAALVVFENNNNGEAFWKAVGFEKRRDLDYLNKVINIENK